MASSQQTEGGSQLDWQSEHDRTPPAEREPYPRGFRVSRSEAFVNVLMELRQMDVRNVQITTGADRVEEAKCEKLHWLDQRLQEADPGDRDG